MRGGGQTLASHHMPKEPENDQTYSEAMDAWRTRVTLVQQLKRAHILPPEGAPVLGIIFGYLWRLMVILGLVMVMGNSFLSKHLKGKGFKEHLTEQVNRLFQAKETELARVSWKPEWEKLAGTFTIKEADVTGGADSFFYDLKASQTRFTIPIFGMFRKHWDVGTVSLGELDLHLRAGWGGVAGTEAPVAESVRRRLGRILMAGYGISPDFSQVKHGSIYCDKALLRWGTEDITRGRIEDARMEFHPRDEKWTIEAFSGRFQQNWWTPMDIRSLQAVFDPARGRLDIVEGRIAQEVSGLPGTLAGYVTTGDVPQFKLKMEFPSIDLAGLAPATLRGNIGGTAKCIASLTGSTNEAAGIRSEVTLDITNGVLRDVPMFKNISLATGRSAFRRITITSGMISFRTENKVFRTTHFNLKGEEMLAIQGEITCKSGEFTGSLKIGLGPDAFRIPGIREKYFTESRDGKVWATLEVDNVTSLVGVGDLWSREMMQDANVIRQRPND